MTCVGFARALSSARVAAPKMRTQPIFFNSKSPLDHRKRFLVVANVRRLIPVACHSPRFEPRYLGSYNSCMTKARNPSLKLGYLNRYPNSSFNRAFETRLLPGLRFPLLAPPPDAGSGIGR